MDFKSRLFNKSHIPNFFTFLNEAFGILAILETFSGQYIRATLFIFAAGLVDRYDGRIARWLGAESSLGRELDSLADNISFGIAPAILVYFHQSLGRFGFLGYLFIAFYCICGTYRLARYNSIEFDGTFSGIPITIAGPTLAILTHLFGKTVYSPYLMLFFLVLLGLLMASTLKIKKR